MQTYLNAKISGIVNSMNFKHTTFCVEMRPMTEQHRLIGINRFRFFINENTREIIQSERFNQIELKYLDWITLNAIDYFRDSNGAKSECER